MDLPRQSTLLNQSFGMCIGQQDILIPCYYGPGIIYYRPWRWGKQVSEDFGSTIQDFKDKFQIVLDIQNFQPSEISVKVANNEVIIEGKHDEREDNIGFISRSFKRRYLLPHNCSEDSVESSMSSDGILRVTGLKNKIKESKEITVPIQVSANKTDCKTVKDKNELTQSFKEEPKLQCQDNNNKCTAVMLKEEHCCLLKPELLGKMASTTEMSTGKLSEDRIIDPDNVSATSSKTSVQQLDQSKDCQKKRETNSTTVENTTSNKPIAQLLEQSEDCLQKLETNSTNVKNITASSISTSESSQIESTITEVQATSSIESSALSSLNASANIYEIICDISSQLKEAAENL